MLSAPVHGQTGDVAVPRLVLAPPAARVAARGGREEGGVHCLALHDQGMAETPSPP